MPDLFTAIVPVAGYGLGTLEPTSKTQAPQPESSDIFKSYLDEYAPRLAQVPFTIAVHAPSDKVCSFLDTESIVEEINSFGGNAELVSVDASLANPDKKKKRK